MDIMKAKGPKIRVRQLKEHLWRVTLPNGATCNAFGKDAFSAARKVHGLYGSMTADAIGRMGWNR